MQAERSNRRWWRHSPWLLSLLIAPWFAGAVTPLGQVVIAALLASSWLLLSEQIGGFIQPVVPSWLKWSALALLLVSLVPLPLPLVQWLSPERVALARQFPLDPHASTYWLPLTVSAANTLDRLWNLCPLLAG
ncbi:MAG: hypothetical protein KGS61_16440, partial [Verrucomicrobia bacterium]|nr:hypothetical protein [Verrucomicrobiota bacterium]